MAVISLTVFGWDLPSEPHFVDESAYISQSFYADLWLDGQWDDPAWLAYGGYDLPPLPKYSIGLALRLHGYQRPGRAAMAAWYLGSKDQFKSYVGLTAARRPSVFFGAIGCLAIYAIGCTARDRLLGIVAALFLMLNPLYAMHARRAMSDVYAESLILSTAAIGLWAWKRILLSKPALRPGLALAIGAGAMGGLATLSKLNGALALFILSAWAVLSLPLPTIALRARITIVLATIGAGGVSFLTFAALNPFLFAHPRNLTDPAFEALANSSFMARVKIVADHRVNVSEGAKDQFPKDALRTSFDKVKAVVVQGYGRFGPFGPRGGFDSTIRFDRKQDRGAWIGFPWVAVGAIAAWYRGRTQLRQGEPPAAWAVLVQAIVSLSVVTAFIPLAWDRYFLSIQPGSALLGAFAAIEGFDLVRSAFRSQPVSEASL